MKSLKIVALALVIMASQAHGMFTGWNNWSDTNDNDHAELMAEIAELAKRTEPTETIEIKPIAIPMHEVINIGDTDTGEVAQVVARQKHAAMNINNNMHQSFNAGDMDTDEVAKAFSKKANTLGEEKTFSKTINPMYIRAGIVVAAGLVLAVLYKGYKYFTQSTDVDSENTNTNEICNDSENLDNVSTNKTAASISVN